MYQYLAYTADKKIVEGVIDASTEDAAEERLLASGYAQVLTLRKSLPEFSFKGIFSWRDNVKKTEIVEFFSQLASLIESGMPFVQALSILAEQTKKAAFRKMIQKIGREVAGGNPFSQALEAYPKLVSPHYCQVIKVSERTGDLPGGLRLVAGYMDKENATSHHIRRMLSYPAFLGFMSLVVMIIVSIVAVPSLMQLFTALDISLPLPTRMLIAIAGFITNYKFHVLAGVLLLVGIGTLLRKNPSFKRFIDTTSLRLPVVSGIVIMRNIGRFCRSSALLIGAGLTLPQALNAIIGTIDSDTIKGIFTEVRQEIIKGKGLSQPMSKVKIFPRLLVDMVSIGEKTGNLQSSFSTMADYYEKRLDQRVQRLLGLVEPASIIIVGLIIAFIGIAIIMPMYSIYKVVQVAPTS